MEITNISQEYIQAVKSLKDAILRSRYHAAKQVNKEMLALNYAIGKFISIHSRKAQWGTNALKVISELLRQELPGLKGYSEANLKVMRSFFEAWSTVFENRQSATDEFEMNTNISAIPSKIEIRQLTTDDLSKEDIEAFNSIGFTHHYTILLHSNTFEERLFYIKRCAKEFWSVKKLEYQLKSGLYSREGHIAQTNFNKTIADDNFKRKALQSFKDEYLLDFINIEDPEEVDEREIEQSIIQNIKNFIMAFGKDFAFMGNQYRLTVDGHDYYIDLLFFSRRLKSLVAFELKRGEFKPEYTGKLNFYLSALDEYVKLPEENPSIGIILCKSKSNKIVELSFRDTTKPMGVATYRTSSELPKELREALPDMEELKKLM